MAIRETFPSDTRQKIPNTLHLMPYICAHNIWPTIPSFRASRKFESGLSQYQATPTHYARDHQSSSDFWSASTVQALHSYFSHNKWAILNVKDDYFRFLQLIIWVGSKSCRDWERYFGVKDSLKKIFFSEM